MDPITSGVLTNIDRAKAWLASFDGTAEDLADVRDQASAWVEFFRHCRSGLEAQNTAAELKIRLERKLGGMLGDPPPMGRPRKSAGRAHFPEIDRRDASRLRKIAAVPEGELLAYFHTCNEEGLEITSAGVLRLYAALTRRPTESDTVAAEVESDDDEVRPEFWKSADTCRDEVRRCARKLKDIRTVLSGLVESPYKPLLTKAAHGDPAVALDWTGGVDERAAPLGSVLVSKTYTCPAIESLTSLVAGLELLFDREAGG